MTQFGADAAALSLPTDRAAQFDECTNRPTLIYISSLLKDQSKWNDQSALVRHGPDDFHAIGEKLAIQHALAWTCEANLAQGVGEQECNARAPCNFVVKRERER